MNEPITPEQSKKLLQAPDRYYNREVDDRCDFGNECDEINYGADETKTDYTAFYIDNCRMCGSQICPGDHEAIDMCGKNPNSNYAVRLHSKKLIIGEENMVTYIGGEAIGGSGSLPTVTADGKKFKADNTCETCANKDICKYVDYYSGLITSTQQISVDSNFELRLRCKRYRNEAGIRG